MSIPEQTGKVATSAIDALKGNPLCLAVVALTIVLSIMAFMRERHSQDERVKMVADLVERCFPLNAYEQHDAAHNPPGERP